MSITLLYHDMVESGQEDASGFAGAGAARYKLTWSDFRDHAHAIARAVPQRGPLFTFDDGGISAAATADLLESHGWRGHFFITADYIGTRSFLSAAQIRDLHARGHVIGSHSCSHPQRMSFCSRDELLREWRQSCHILSDTLGAAVDAASVPGGFYSKAVARAAAESGIKVLFNSEPTTRPRYVDGCMVLGRYTIYRGMSARSAAAVAAGTLTARLKQSLMWNAKKAAKAVGGRVYLSVRERLLRRAYAH